MPSGFALNIKIVGGYTHGAPKCDTLCSTFNNKHECVSTNQCGVLTQRYRHYTIRGIRDFTMNNFLIS